MHILILNWRDIKNPLAGGAEILTHEMAKRWVRQGHQVTQVSERFIGALAKEHVDNVVIIRYGRWWNISLWAFVLYISSLSKKIDVIIDEIHWFPFLSILYAGKRVVFLVCEVANPLFFKLLPYPVALIARMFEKVALGLYKRAPVIAISDSTKQDLIREGFDGKKITVIPLGITKPQRAIRHQHKERIPTIVYVGRMHKLKGIEDALETFRLIHKIHKSWRFWIIGKGEPEYVRTIAHIIHKNQLEKTITLFGFVPEERKFELLSRAHLLIAPSLHEGWGLMVMEASLMGTPAVGYNSGALKDSIVDNETGVLVEIGNCKRLAKEIIALIDDKKRYERLQRNGIQRARAMSWEKTAENALGILTHYHEI